MTAVQNQTARSWDNPPGVASRGTLIVVPGRGEHPGVYTRFGTRLSFDAYQVRAVDDPTRDEAGVRAEIHELLADPNLPAPHVLVGSDTGALFAVGLVAAGEAKVDALVLAGLPSRQKPSPRESSTPESSTPEFSPPETSPHDTTPDEPPSQNNDALDWDSELIERTSCPTHQARLKADDTVVHGAIGEAAPDGWFERADLAAVDVPVLGLHGASDTLSPLADVRPQYRSAGNATLVSIANGKHDALNDATHRTAAATVVLFLERLKLGAQLPPIATTEA